MKGFELYHLKGDVDRWAKPENATEIKQVWILDGATMRDEPHASVSGIGTFPRWVTIDDVLVMFPHLTDKELPLTRYDIRTDERLDKRIFSMAGLETITQIEDRERTLPPEAEYGWCDAFGEVEQTASEILELIPE